MGCMPPLFYMIKFPRLVFALLLFVSFYSINRGRKVDCRSTKTTQTFIEYPPISNSSNFVFFLLSLWQETRVLRHQRLAGGLVTCRQHHNCVFLYSLTLHSTFILKNLGRERAGNEKVCDNGYYSLFVSYSLSVWVQRKRRFE